MRRLIFAAILVLGLIVPAAVSATDPSSVAVPFNPIVAPGILRDAEGLLDPAAAAFAEANPDYVARAAPVLALAFGISEQAVGDLLRAGRLISLAALQLIGAPQTASGSGPSPAERAVYAINVARGGGVAEPGQLMLVALRWPNATFAQLVSLTVSSTGDGNPWGVYGDADGWWAHVTAVMEPTLVEPAVIPATSLVAAPARYAASIARLRIYIARLSRSGSDPAKLALYRARLADYLSR